MVNGKPTDSRSSFIVHRSSFAPESYGAFAYAYDQALGETFFLAVRRVLDDALFKYPARAKTHLDLACGTGFAIEYFEKRGFRSAGVDASPAMLAVGRKRSSRLIAADIRSLPLRRAFGRITCLYDSLNHLQTREALVDALEATGSVMNDACALFFELTD